MKKFLALVLALILGLIGTNLPAAVADVANKTETTFTMDTPAAVKADEWLAGYKLRCRTGKRLRGQRRRNPILKRIALAPLALIFGAIGDIVAPAMENDPDVAEAKRAAKQREWHHSMANAMEEYEAQVLKEAEELRREAALEAKAAARAEAKKAREAEKAQKKAEQKAEKERLAAERLENDKAEARKIGPVAAIDLVRRIKAEELLLDEIRDQLDQIRSNRDETVAKAVELRKAAATIAAELKRPTSSSRYRKAVVAAEVATEKANELTNECKATVKVVDELENELHDMRYQARMIKKNGNAFAKEALVTEFAKFEEEEKAKKAEENKTLRPLQKIAERMKTDSFTLYSFDKSQILAAYIKYLTVLIEKIDKKATDDEKDAALLKKREALRDLKAFLKQDASNPVVVFEENASVSRLRKSILSMVFNMEYDRRTPTKKWIVIEHGIQETLDKIPLKVFGEDKTLAQKAKEELEKSLYRHIGMRGVKVFGPADERGARTMYMYEGLFSSASHQKDEKLVMAERRLMAIHEEALWFGKTKEQILKTKLTGAQIWKMRANMARPISFALTTKDGKPVYLHDGKMVKDAVRKYRHKNALQIGQKEDENGKPIKNPYGKPYAWLNNAENDVVVGAGAILMMEEMNTSVAQLSGMGLKGCGVDARSSEKTALKKWNKERPEWLKDVKLLFSEDCMKFDKIYGTYDEYVAAMDRLAEKYPGINQVYVLRQGEEVDGQERVRTLTRSLLQQLFAVTGGEIGKLTASVIKKLNAMNSLNGMFSMAAELKSSDEDRSPLARLILKCPALLLEKAIRDIYEDKWIKIKNDAIGNKARTKGQYPYITQDPVALYEIWALGMSPNRNDLGVLRAGEASLNMVQAGYKVVGIRFPANALTAKILECRPCARAFETCGNVCILSIYDDILIVQDGDVDGDEMCILYDRLIVKLVERMRSLINPPVIMFVHSGKTDSEPIETEINLVKRLYDSLWDAKRFDKVGVYANMSRDCAYLASIELRKIMHAVEAEHKATTKKAKNAARNDRVVASDRLNELLLWMAAASTGAILAIDQVKGNKTDQKLTDWLKSIKKALDSTMSVVDETGEIVRCSPATQPFVKGDPTIKALDFNEEVTTDLFGIKVMKGTGQFDPDTKGYVPNTPALMTALCFGEYYPTKVRTGKVTSGILTEIRANYFNSMKVGKDDGTERAVDAKVFAKIKKGEDVGLQDLLELFWHNQCSLQFRSMAKTTPEKRREYHQMVRQTIWDWADSFEWKVDSSAAVAPLGHVFSLEEKKSNILREITKMMLSEKKDVTFRKFLLEVFAEDFEQHVDNSAFAIEDYFDGTVAFAADLGLDCEETVFDDEVLSAPAEDDEPVDLNEVMDGSVWLSDEEAEW